MKSVKTNEEIDKIRKACKLADKTFEYILGKIKLGITEKELAKKINSFIRKNGASLSFRTIVAFGKNSSEIHHKTTLRKLKKGDIVMFDLGAKLDGYCSDITRTLFFGKATEEQKKVYQTVLKSHELAIQQFNNITIKQLKNIKASEVDKVARNYIVSQGYPTIPHSLGHGVGKIVHSGFKLSPKSKTILRTGMVFSIEPGIYLKGKFGVRIEDLVVLKENGIEVLTNSPKELIEL